MSQNSKMKHSENGKNNCWVSSCSSYKIVRRQRLFHAVPQSQIIRQKWCSRLKMEYSSSPSMIVCSNHFTSKDYEIKRKRFIKQLRLSAMPSISYSSDDNEFDSSSTLPLEFQCPICGMTTFCYDNYRAHLKEHPRVKKRLSLFTEANPSKEEPGSHSRSPASSLSIPSISYSFDGKEFDSSSSLPYEFQCPSCDMTTFCYDKYRSHLTEEHPRPEKRLRLYDPSPASSFGDEPMAQEYDSMDAQCSDFKLELTDDDDNTEVSEADRENV